MLGLLELAVPFYGLRLSRQLGTRQVGWALVAAFLALALVRLMGLDVTGINSDKDFATVLLYGLVPVLVLIGMAHVESLYKERKRAEMAEATQKDMVLVQEQCEAYPQVALMSQVAVAAAQHFNRHLGVINVYSKLLLQRRYDRATAQHHKRIAEEAQRATDLGKLLLSTGCNQPIRHLPVNLNLVIAKATPALRRSLGPELELRINCPNALPAIQGDPGQIYFILDVLVRNAGEASAPGARVALRAEAVKIDMHYAQGHAGARPGRFVRVTVSDTGRGMDEADQHHAFEPFFTTKDRTRHPGLGLPSAHGMIKNHGGWVEVNSQRGRGTNVHVFFPMTD